MCINEVCLIQDVYSLSIINTRCVLKSKKHSNLKCRYINYDRFFLIYAETLTKMILKREIFISKRLTVWHDQATKP